MKQFFGFLPLKIGVNICVAINITLALSSFLINSTEINSVVMGPWILCMVCNIYTIFTWLVIVYYGAYKESVRLINIASNMWIVYTIVWIIMVVFLMNDSLGSYVCICERCSESLWLFANKWHNTCKKPGKTMFAGTFSDSIAADIVQPVKSTSHSTEDFKYVALSIIVIFVHLLFDIITLMSYLSELKLCKQCPTELEAVSSVRHHQHKIVKVFKNRRDICKEHA